MPPRTENNRRSGWAGYGFDTPAARGRPCPPSPQEALEECLRAARDILAGTLQVTELAPWTTPPFRSRYRCEHARAIISTTVGLDAATNAAGNALEAALNAVVPGADPVTKFEMAAVGDFFDIFLYSPITAQAGIFSSWGISVANHSPEALAVRVDATGSVGGPPSAPDPTISSHEVSQHQPTQLIVQDDQELKIRVSSLDTTTPLLVNFGVCFWTTPVTKRVDGKEGLRLKEGFGTSCR